MKLFFMMCHWLKLFDFSLFQVNSLITLESAIFSTRSLLDCRRKIRSSHSSGLRVFLYCKPVNLKTLIYIFKCNCRLELVNSTFLMMQISDTTIERSEIKFIYPRISQKPRQNRHRHRIARARLLRVIVFLCFTSHESSIPECIENMC